MKRKVLLPQPIEEEAVEYLEKSGFETLTADNPAPESVIPLLKDAEAVALRTGIKFDRDLIGTAEKLLTISRTGGGVDNVDLDAATEAGILVTSSLGVNTSSVAEHCLALMLALYKQLPLMDKEVRNNNFRIRYKNLPRDLYGKTLGVIGFGRIGSALARICCDSFGMTILAYDEFLPEEIKKSHEGFAEFVTLDDIYRISDLISLHIPATDETRGMINAEVFEKMKTDAVLINASRGGIVDEKALAEALTNGIIAGAGLDVFRSEPVEESNPLLGLDNCILTPHTAALTSECVVRMAVSAAERIVDVFNGRNPGCIANPGVLKHPRWQSLDN